MIEVSNLRKTFRDVEAVRNLSFHAPDGAITGLLGANGAGKTTTLRMICGVLAPDAGAVRIDDREARTVRDRVGALLDHAGLYPRLTVRENLAYFAELQGIAAPKLGERVAGAIATLGIEAIADRRTDGFSQGERMKTALARAIIHRPRNVLLDEPTNGLDVPSVRSLRQILRRMRDDGQCVILSSHVLEEVRLLCDNVAIVCEGRVVAQGSPQELCRRTECESLEDAFIKLTGSEEVSECLSGR